MRNCQALTTDCKSRDSRVNASTKPVRIWSSGDFRSVCAAQAQGLLTWPPGGISVDEFNVNQLTKSMDGPFADQPGAARY